MKSTEMQPFLTADLSEVGNLFLQAGKGMERPPGTALSMCKWLKPRRSHQVAAAELSGGQDKDWPHSHVC